MDTKRLVAHGGQDSKEFGNLKQSQWFQLQININGNGYTLGELVEN